MSTNNDIARIIESKKDEIIINSLLINFPSQEDLNFLFTPKLENMAFIAVKDTITINLKNIAFRTYFNEWLQGFMEKINLQVTSENLIDTFNREVKNVVMFGQKEKKLSMSQARGLFGELLVLQSLLEKEIYSQKEILEGWHRPAPANHDFDYPDFTLETKTISRSNTTVKITSEDQLTAFEEKELKLKIYRIENINKSEDSLGILFNEIKGLLNPSLSNYFEIKCAEDAFCKYLGPEFMPLDYKFVVIDDFTYKVDQKEFPRVKQDQFHSGISKISYNLDLSVIEPFKLSLDE